MMQVIVLPSMSCIQCHVRSSGWTTNGSNTNAKADSNTNASPKPQLTRSYCRPASGMRGGLPSSLQTIQPPCKLIEPIDQSTVGSHQEPHSQFQCESLELHRTSRAEYTYQSGQATHPPANNTVFMTRKMLFALAANNIQYPQMQSEHECLPYRPRHGGLGKFIWLAEDFHKENLCFRSQLGIRRRVNSHRVTPCLSGLHIIHIVYKAFCLLMLCTLCHSMSGSDTRTLHMDSAWNSKMKELFHPMLNT